MRRKGQREDEPNTRCKPCQREMRLTYLLKTPWPYDRLFVEIGRMCQRALAGPG